MSESTATSATVGYDGAMPVAQAATQANAVDAAGLQRIVELAAFHRWLGVRVEKIHERELLGLSSNSKEIHPVTDFIAWSQYSDDGHPGWT